MRRDHPYKNLKNAVWLRGNLHTHSTRSDGAHAPQDVIRMYAKAGYDFLMMSDHDIHTTPADYAALKTHGLSMLPGNEITANGVHMLHVDADRLVPPPRGTPAGAPRNRARFRFRHHQPFHVAQGVRSLHLR